MNENINLCELLKGHEGEEFYCSLLGKNVYLKTIGNNSLVFDYSDSARNYIVVFGNGAYHVSMNGECIIFPSKTQRDWNKWVEEYNHNDPKTWSELEAQGKSNNYIIGNGYGEVSFTDKGNTPIEKSALALLKIHQLIEVGYGGNITNEEWKDDEQEKYVIGYVLGITTGICYNERNHIAFHTEKQRDEFLSYPENIQLVKDFYMI